MFGAQHFIALINDSLHGEVMDQIANDLRAIILKVRWRICDSEYMKGSRENGSTDSVLSATGDQHTMVLVSPHERLISYEILCPLWLNPLTASQVDAALDR
jgi:hypothetical protein